MYLFHYTIISNIYIDSLKKEADVFNKEEFMTAMKCINKIIILYKQSMSVLRF